MTDCKIDLTLVRSVGRIKVEFYFKELELNTYK